MRVLLAPWGGEGFLGVIQQVDAGHYTDMGKFPAVVFARCNGCVSGVTVVKPLRLILL